MTALRRFKLAGPMGADINPSGPEQSHGTLLNTYPPRQSGNPPPGTPYATTTEGQPYQHDRGVDFLFDSFHYDPDTQGQFNQEVIG